MHLSLLDVFRERPSTYSNKWNPYLTISFTWSLHEKDQARYPFPAEPPPKTPESNSVFLLIRSYWSLRSAAYSFAVLCSPLWLMFVLWFFQWEMSGQQLTKNWDSLLEIFYRIEQWPSQCVLKNSVVAKIIRFERVRASAYISLDVSFMVTLWNHGIPSRPRSCSLFFISIC